MAHIAADLIKNAQQWGDTRVWHCGGSGASARTLLAATAACSAALSRRPINCTPGARVGFLGLNTPEYFLALLAAADAGAIACPLNWRWSATELAAALALVAPAAVFVDTPCLDLLRAARARPDCPSFAAVLLTPLSPRLAAGKRTVCSSPESRDGAGCGTPSRDVMHSSPGAPGMITLDELLGTGAAELGCSIGASSSGSKSRGGGSGPMALQLRQAPTGAALIVFTSGTTSAPKGAVLTHAALVHQVRHGLGNRLQQSLT
jgi:acyl-CoA synthetase (AMP-forming)/AMP-acid ligase II